MKKRTAIIKVGSWFYDHNGFTIHQEKGYSGYVDTKRLDEAKVIEWLKHLTGKRESIVSKKDLTDFLSICKIVLSLDQSKFRKLHRKPYTDIDEALYAAIEDRIGREQDAEDAAWGVELAAKAASEVSTEDVPAVEVPEDIFFTI